MIGTNFTANAKMRIVTKSNYYWSLSDYAKAQSVIS